MNSEVKKVIERGWYRQHQTFGEGGWGEFYSQAGYSWKVYVLYGQHKEEKFSVEIEKIVAKDDKTALSAFSSLYNLDRFIYWEVQEEIVEFRLVNSSDNIREEE